jgi:hypothetical protein
LRFSGSYDSPKWDLLLAERRRDQAAHLYRPAERRQLCSRVVRGKTILIPIVQPSEAIGGFSVVDAVTDQKVLADSSGHLLRAASLPDGSD